VCRILTILGWQILTPLVKVLGRGGGMPIESKRRGVPCNSNKTYRDEQSVVVLWRICDAVRSKT